MSEFAADRFTVPEAGWYEFSPGGTVRLVTDEEIARGVQWPKGAAVLTFDTEPLP